MKVGRKIHRDDQRESVEELKRLLEVYTDAVIFPEERSKEARSKWSLALLGKFLGKKFDADFVTRDLRYKWRLVGDLEIIPLLEGFIIFRFSNDEVLHRVRIGGWRSRGPILSRRRRQLLRCLCG